MPCAAGELCLVLARTPKRPDGHECRGKCGGRLHGLCGVKPIRTATTQCSASAMIALPPSDIRRARARWSSPKRESARRQTRAVLMIRRGTGAVPPRPTWNFRRSSFLWGAQRRRAVMAMPPSICRRPGCRSSKRMPLSQCSRQT